MWLGFLYSAAFRNTVFIASYNEYNTIGIRCLCTVLCLSSFISFFYYTKPLFCSQTIHSWIPYSSRIPPYHIHHHMKCIPYCIPYILYPNDQSFPSITKNPIIVHCTTEFLPCHSTMHPVLPVYRIPKNYQSSHTIATNYHPVHPILGYRTPAFSHII